MKTMSPMTVAESWWSEGLGQPASSGSANGTRYAFFPDKKLLLIEKGGKLQKFATGEHRIGGVSQDGVRAELAFTSQHGPVKLDDLHKIG